MAQGSKLSVGGIDRKSIYETIREEILDQKRCQFQLFSLAVTASSLILAYAAANQPMPLVYLAPVVMNDVALIMILDKAVSVQRKVGYLQMMEQHFDDYAWKWETQLDTFRGEVRLYSNIPYDPARKHSYITSVGWMLVGLNILSASLAIFPPDTSNTKLWASPYGMWILLGLSVGLVGFGVVFLIWKRHHLIKGRHSGPAIQETWKTVLKDYKV